MKWRSILSISPSGSQFEIRAGDQHATIVEVGGGIREYSVGERPVLESYPLDAICDGAHGALLIPWPNRLSDGRYQFKGMDYQVPLSEPGNHNAIHGFMRWRSWAPVEHESNRVVMASRLHPQPGYPFTLDLQVSYELSEQGLSVSTTATNLSDRPCPYGFGQHPYLSPGMGSIDDCELHLDAETRVVTDNERQLPTGTEPVEGTAYDFRRPRRLGDQAIDSAFTDLARDSEDRAWARLTAPDKSRVELWVDEHHKYIEIYTGDTLDPLRRRCGLGTEPMTCAPDAFHSGEGLIELAPDQAVTSRWGVRLAAP